MNNKEQRGQMGIEVVLSRLPDLNTFVKMQAKSQMPGVPSVNMHMLGR